jgi:hypothetical protein
MPQSRLTKKQTKTHSLSQEVKKPQKLSEADLLSMICANIPQTKNYVYKGKATGQDIISKKYLAKYIFFVVFGNVEKF